jgi:hypothetical protein
MNLSTYSSNKHCYDCFHQFLSSNADRTQSLHNQAFCLTLHNHCVMNMRNLPYSVTYYVFNVWA